ncbi:hypothetical protein [Tenacibaculum jejuense]|uniref:Probable lipoprotein n=1 Tax=Tenacibaculum jejuense TaxID=584609 RepID=A0A238U9Q8_9FLAO|nr:hypothetical protein [Tenacibaculum jejuense]SNR15150.1 Probable lipoprotein precursor [Tenacibaculum jejuense]
MKTKLFNFFTAFCILFLSFSSCKNNEKEKKTVQEEKTEKISIEKLTESPAYSDATLQLNQPGSIANTIDGKVEFNFEINNYTLGAQTDSPNTKKLANSGKGQHIHFILNNQPYSAHYEPKFTKEIPEGTHHLVAFLSRSYHESVKNENSVIVKKLVVGENSKDSLTFDIASPTLIYSRPKGTYSGEDAKHLLLDFFVLNTTLSEKGNKVKANINGEEFLITEWAPYVIKGLPLGEVTIQLELIDAQGNPIPGPFNKVKRTVTLK